jgi:hypothetical protein
MGPHFRYLGKMIVAQLVKKLSECTAPCLQKPHRPLPTVDLSLGQMEPTHIPKYFQISFGINLPHMHGISRFLFLFFPVRFLIFTVPYVLFPAHRVHIDLFCLITFRLQLFSNLLLFPLSEGQIFTLCPLFKYPYSVCSQFCMLDYTTVLYEY